MKTEIFNELNNQLKKYPCAMKYECENRSQELVVLFTDRTTGTIVHQKGTGYTVGIHLKCFNADDVNWQTFKGSIKFS